MVTLNSFLCLCRTTSGPIHEHESAATLNCSIDNLLKSNVGITWSLMDPLKLPLPKELTVKLYVTLQISNPNKLRVLGSCTRFSVTKIGGLVLPSLLVVRIKYPSIHVLGTTVLESILKEKPVKPIFVTSRVGGDGLPEEIVIMPDNYLRIH